MSKQHAPNFVEHVVGSELEPIASACLVICGLTLFGFVAKRSLRALEKQDALVPDERLTFRNVLELVAEGVLSVSDSTMGKENRRYIPFVGSLFIYILVLNLFGLIPGFSAPSDSLSFNLGLGLTVFIAYNIWGIKTHGVWSYLKHFGGPLWSGWLSSIAILVTLIELISHCFRPVTLSLRLFANMTADHSILSAFTELAPYGIPVVFYFAGAFVATLQAFVFALLTMIYISFAVAHEGEEGQGEHAGH